MSLSVRKKRQLIRGFIGLVLCAILAFSAAGAFFYGQLGPVESTKVEAEVLFNIEKGSTPGQIAKQLKKEGLIKNERVFLLYARLQGKINKFKAGQYIISPAYNTPQIIDIIEAGKVATMSFTIPEGYNLRQIAAVMVDKGICTQEEFWRAINEEEYDYPFLKDLPDVEYRLEGYLFPDTYSIPLGMKVEQVINTMLKRFAQVYDNLPPNETGLSTHEVVTLASIVEGESLVDEERPLVASVFFNRLKIGMKLDSDATIQYLFDEHKERVLFRDLEIDSPYNTYRNKGLPPGPIGSPGEASLRAVLEPADSNYWYFVAKKDGSGEHVFSVTLEEHNRNKRLLGY